MKKLLFIIWILSVTICSAQNNTITLENSIDWTPTLSSQPRESITKVEAVKDTLYVYKTVYPAYTGISCAVFHLGETCSWDEPSNLREVYALKEGVMTLIRKQHPEMEKVEKTTYEYKEVWK